MGVRQKAYGLYLKSFEEQISMCFRATWDGTIVCSSSRFRVSDIANLVILTNFSPHMVSFKVL